MRWWCQQRGVERCPVKAVGIIGPQKFNLYSWSSTSLCGNYHGCWCQEYARKTIVYSLLWYSIFHLICNNGISYSQKLVAKCQRPVGTSSNLPATKYHETTKFDRISIYIYMYTYIILQRNPNRHNHHTTAIDKLSEVWLLKNNNMFDVLRNPTITKNKTLMN